MNDFTNVGKLKTKCFFWTIRIVRRVKRVHLNSPKEEVVTYLSKMYLLGKMNYLNSQQNWNIYPIDNAFSFFSKCTLIIDNART